MTARVLRPAITASTVIAVLVAAIAMYAFLTVGTTHADSTFNPTTVLHYCNAMPNTFPDPQIVGNPNCVDNLTPGAAADNTNILTFPVGDLNFSNVVTLAPSGETINAGTAASVGTKIGGLHSDTTLGLLNGACSSLVPVDFVFYNVALPNNASGSPRSTGGSPELGVFDPFGTGLATNIAFPQPQGSDSRFGFWHVGAEATNTPADAVTYTGTALQADGTNIGIQNYPSYLLDIFDPDWVPGVSDGAALPIVPKAVYGGISNITGTPVPLYFAQFSAGALLTLPAPLGQAGGLTAAMGQPSVSVLNDPSESKLSPSSITDFCTRNLITTTLLGTSVTGGFVRATSPAAGTAITIQYNASLRDLDQDSFENALDTCPSVPDIGAGHWDPRALANPNDTDSDGISNTCDIVNNPGFADQDTDTFQNRQDNCPQISNLSQADSSIASTAADNGPRTDSIGDACTGVALAAGGIGTSATFMQNGVSVTVDVSNPNIAHGRYMTATNVMAKCIGGTDADGDGYCTAQDSGTDSGACALTVPASCFVRHNAWASGLATSSLDSDGDGFSDAVETYLGTDATKSCAQTPVPPSTVGGAGDETVANWPFDFNNNRLAGIEDVSTFSSRFGKPVNATAGLQRWDLNANGIIDIGDVSKYSSVFGKRCGQGTAGMPGPWFQQ